jgi:hypothetical protein
VAKISVTHLPSGTGKWNRIVQNWRGKPLVSHQGE